MRTWPVKEQVDLWDHYFRCRAYYINAGYDVARADELALRDTLARSQVRGTRRTW